VRADVDGMDEEEWALRYFLEDQLVQAPRAEEEYWRRRGRQNWILFGDANTKYFHTIANDRRRKCAITSLRADNFTILDKVGIQKHVYEFYISLMGTEDPKPIKLGAVAWQGPRFRSRRMRV
jgi:hypothetical protein